jgi:DNA-binding NarL/FixJ family response regulator
LFRIGKEEWRRIVKIRGQSKREGRAANESGAALELTSREREVLARLLAGDANKDIAMRLGCSVRTVEFHVSSLLRKTGSSNRLQLVTHPLVAVSRE